MEGIGTADNQHVYALSPGCLIVTKKLVDVEIELTRQG